MAHIFDEFPTRDAILGFRPPALAARLLLDLQGDSLNRHNFLLEVNRRYGNDEAVARAFLQAWGILVVQGHLVEKTDSGWFFVSDDAEKEKNRLRVVGTPVPTPRRLVASRWSVVRELSAGGQGVTSVVTDEQSSTGTLYVLKELKNASNAQAQRRFANEAKALAGLDHPNILKIVAFDAEADHPWYVSEFCQGGGLDRADLAMLDIGTRLRVFEDVCGALAAAHDSGITHRDLKPENILLRSSRGPAVLGDFGICWFLEADEERLTRTHEDIGSSFCRAPELFDGPLENVKPTADVYCLGKLLYWLLVGKGGRAGRVAREDFERGGRNLVTMFKDDRYEHFNILLRRMITENPSERFKDANEVLNLSQHAIELFMSNYQPINRAPSRCTYCGQGRYEQKDEGRGTSTEHALMSTWYFYICDLCGHTLLFRKNAQSNRW
jgi:serine/threonine protein kinase